jgi:hypothetical protein
MPNWTRLFTIVVGTLATVGLVLSVASHIAAALGSSGPLGAHVWILHIGVFVLIFPTIFVLQFLTEGFDRRDHHKAIFRGCPPWMRYTLYSCFGYAALNFILFVTYAPKHPEPGLMSSIGVGGFSGHWIAFYSYCATLCYSVVSVIDGRQRCRAGHEVGPRALFCDQCGESVDRVPFHSSR